jgi:hypothetical protein
MTVRSIARSGVSAIAIVTALAAVTAACGNKVQVKTTSADVSSIARNRTYAHDPADGTPPGSSDPARAQQLLETARKQIDGELQRKGYALAAPGEADMIVRVTSAVRQVVDEPTGAMAAAGAPGELDTVGSLSIEIVERASRESLFRGVAKKEIHTRRVAENEVAAAVTEILEKVPASQAGAGSPH